MTKMRSLCYLVAVMTTASASRLSESEKVEKRIVGNLTDGVLEGEGDGLLGNPLSQVGIIESVLGGEDGVLSDSSGGNGGGLLGASPVSVTRLVGTLLNKIKVLSDKLAECPAQKTNKWYLTGKLKKYPVNSVCLACSLVPKPKWSAVCKLYCRD